VKTSLLDTFSERGCRFLGTRYPILCGAMTWVSDPKLVAAVCDAGGFASLAGGNSPTEILEQQIRETRELTDKPFGLNVITIAPAYRDHLELAGREKLPFVIFAGSFPRRPEIELAKKNGAKVLCFASTQTIAQRMVEYGADALVLEGMEAGGHVGHVTLAILLQQVLFKVDDVPVFVAGGLGTGRMCAHLLLMGAAGVQMGTRFALSRESCAHPRFKETFIKAKARDAVSTPQIDSRLPVVPVRALRNEGTDDFRRLQVELIAKLGKGEIDRTEAQVKVEEFWVGRLRNAVVDGDVSHGSLMAGQSVGLVDKEMTVQEIIDDIVGEAEAELKRVQRSFPT
jgi:enoyl-[acyl-carrier protein] reductase II